MSLSFRLYLGRLIMTKLENHSVPALTLDWLTDALYMRHNRDRGHGSLSSEIQLLMGVLMGDDFEEEALNVVKVITQENAWTAILLDELGCVVGMGTVNTLWTMHGKEARIDNFVILPEFQGYGYGERLLHVLLKKAQKESVHFIEMTSERKRHNAHALYRRAGFKVVGSCVLRREG